MQRFFYKLIRYALWSAPLIAVFVAIASQFRILEVYSSPPFGGSVQVYTDRSGWVIWLTGKSCFERWLYACHAPYGPQVPASLIDQQLSESAFGPAWEYVGVGTYFAKLPRVRATIRLGARHWFVIALTLACVAILHTFAIVAKRLLRPDDSANSAGDHRRSASELLPNNTGESRA